MASQRAVRIEQDSCKLPTLEYDSTSDFDTGGYRSLFAKSRPVRIIFVVTSVAALLAIVALTTINIRFRANVTPQATTQPLELATEHLALQCSYDVTTACPALSIFWNPEVHEVATENLMQVGSGHLVHADRDMVRSSVAAIFRNVSLQLEAQADQLAGELSLVVFSESDKNLILTWLRLLSIPMVQRIGFEVALAIRQALAIEPKTVKRQIEMTLRTNLEDLKAKRDKLASKPLLEFWGKKHRWQMTLDSENLQIMEAFHGGVFFGSDIYAPKKHLTQSERVNAVTGGVLEQVRAIFDIIKLRSHLAGWYPEMPKRLTSIEENVDLGSQILSCELNTKVDGTANFMKALFCPLKFGSQGLDALRAIDDLTKETESTVTI